MSSEPSLRVTLVSGRTGQRSRVSDLLRESSGALLVSEAACAHDVLGAAETGQPDCVVLDDSLSDGSMLALVEELARDAGCPPYPIVVVTDVPAVATAALLRAGAQECLGRSWLSRETLMMAVQSARVRHAMLLERKQSEAQLRRHTETFYSLIKNNPFGVYLVDADFRLAEVSAGAQKVFERVQPLLQRDFGEVLRIVWTEPFASEAIARFRHTLESGESFVSPRTVQFRNDIRVTEAYDWRIDRVALPDGRFGVVCYFYDLSERQQWEAALAASEERLRFSLSAASAGSWDWDVRTGASVWSRENYELYDYDPAKDNPSYAEWVARVHPEDVDQTDQQLKDVVAGRRSEFEAEFRVVRRDGSVRWLFGRARTQLAEDGTTARMSGINIDITDRKLIEEKLADREKHLRLALQAAQAVSFEWDIPTNTVRRLHTPDYALPEGESATYSLEDVLAAVHPDDRTSFRAAVVRALKDPSGTYSSEYRVIRPDGSVRWMHDRGQIEFDADGNPTRLLGVAHDTTPQREAARFLAESEHRLRLAMETAAIGMWEWDTKSRRVTWSPQCFLIHGVQPQAFDGTEEAFDRLLHPEDRERVWASVRRAVDQKAKYECEFRILRPEGDVRWVANLGRALYDTAGQPLRMIGTITDISDRKAAEERLRVSEERYRATFDNAAVGIAHVGLDGRWLRFNAAVTELTGYPAEELRTRTVAEVTHPDDIGAELDQARRLREGEISTFRMEKRFVRPDGSIAWACVTKSLLRNRSGALENFISVLEDITPRKNVEAQLNAARARLAEQFAELEAIYRTAPLGLAVIDRDMRFQRVNDRLAEINGVPVSDHLGKAVGDVTPALREQAQTALQAVLLSGSMVRMEFRVDATGRTATERIRDERWYPLHDLRGSVVGVGLVIEDVTERRRLEQVLRANEALFRALANNLPHLAWMADGEGDIFWHNRRWDDYSAEPPPRGGEGWELIAHPEHAERVTRSLRQAFAAQSDWEETFPLRG